MPQINITSLAILLISGITSATVGTQTTHAHNGGIPPRFYTLKSKGNGVVYEGAQADQTNLYLKGSAASIPFEAVVYF
jgi:hypothetical protein